MTAIKKCEKKCENNYQDSVYGGGLRVHNKTVKGWRCTVCANEIREDNKR